MIYKILKFTQFFLKLFFGLFSRIIPKKSGLIIFCSDRYNENSRYVYEYMVEQNIKNIFWLSYNKHLSNHLKKQQMPYLSNYFIQIWMLMRASVVVASGNSFWDRYGAVSKPTKKYCLMHGCGPKVTEYHDDFKITVSKLKQINNFDFVNFPSPYGSMLGANIYKLPRDKIVMNGYPRFDQLFKANNDSYTKIRLELSDYLNLKISKNTCLCLYTPTFRKYDNNYTFPIEKLEDYNPEELDIFLKKNNIYLIYTKHPQTIDVGGWEKLENCIYLSYEKNQLFDISYFLQAFDVLINDYSTVSVDFSILKRPQIFVVPDLSKYAKTDGFNEEYMDVILGPSVKKFSDFVTQLSNYSNLKLNRESFSYKSNPKKDLRKYWCIDLMNSCKLNSDFLVKISKIINLK